MEIEGRIIQKLEPLNGVSKAGKPWSKQEYVLETVENFPKKIMFDFFGEKAAQYPLEIGQHVRVSVDLESREFNGKWYTNVHAWKSEPMNPDTTVPVGDPNQPQYAAPAAPATPVDPFGGAAAPQPLDNPVGDQSDDLPF